MNEEKTAKFNSDNGSTDVNISVASYLNNKSLAIRLYSKTKYGLEPFGDLTINLPEHAARHLEENEAYITGDFTENMLQFIRQNRLGEILPEYGYSGYGKYPKVAFDLDRLKEFDPEGVETYLEMHKKITL